MNVSVSSLFSTALSGLTAADAKLNVAASNIANVESTGFKAGRVNLSQAAGGGVQVDSISRSASHGYIDQQGIEGSNTDLPAESVNLILAKTLYRANATVIKIGSQMTGTLLDMLDKHVR